MTVEKLECLFDVILYTYKLYVLIIYNTQLAISNEKGRNSIFVIFELRLYIISWYGIVFFVDRKKKTIVPLARYL